MSQDPKMTVPSSSLSLEPQDQVKTGQQQGESLAAQWSGLCASLPRIWVPSLVEELRYLKLHGVVKKKKKFIPS